METIELILDAKAIIGEAPLWCADLDALYWIDVKAPALYRTAIMSGVTQSWRLPSEVGGYALASDGSGAILGLRTGLYSLEFESASLTQIHESPFDSCLQRFNEGDCDGSGRLWLGTMFDPEADNSSAPIAGELYSFTRVGGLVAHDHNAYLHNGFAWNAENTEFYIAHSRERRIYAYEFDLADGSLGARRVLAEVPQHVGVPDGGAVDAEGFYWSAIHGGGCLHRYAPDGRLDKIIDLPIRNPTMVAFCGRDLRELVITSASHGQRGALHEGGLFKLRPGVVGLPRRAYVS
jgi:sugar lactone lactonase YvrE